MNVFAAVVVMFFSCCNAAEVNSTATKVEEVEDVLYDTLSDFMRARLSLRGVKKHTPKGDAERTVARMVNKYAELSTIYEFCDKAGVQYYEHENVREYGRLLLCYILMNVESAQDLNQVDPRKMMGILVGPAAELAARRAGHKMFIAAANMQEGITDIRDELVVVYGGEAGLQKRMEDIIRLQRTLAEYLLENN
jgi:hypothetical protein